MAGRDPTEPGQVDWLLGWSAFQGQRSSLTAPTAPPQPPEGVAPGWGGLDFRVYTPHPGGTATARSLPPAPHRTGRATAHDQADRQTEGSPKRGRPGAAQHPVVPILHTG